MFSNPQPVVYGEWAQEVIQTGERVKNLGRIFLDCVETNRWVIARLQEVNEAQRLEISRLRKLLEDRG
jgi:hypothetical protein